MRTMLFLVQGLYLLGITLYVDRPGLSLADSVLSRVNDSLVSQPGSLVLAATPAPEACRSGEGWRWMSGDFLPDIALRAQRALQEEGIASEVQARSFGEIDSCGRYRSFAVDFAVTLRSGQSLDGLADTERLGQVVQQLLAPIAQPSLGNVQIMFSNGEQLDLDFISSPTWRRREPANVFAGPGE